MDAGSILLGACLAMVLLLIGIKVGMESRAPVQSKPPKAPKEPKVVPMPLYQDEWDNALQGKPATRIPTVEGE